MTVVAEHTIPADAFSLGRVLAVEPGYTIRLVEFVPTGVDLVPYFWVENEGHGFAAFEERVRDHEAVASLTGLDGHTNRMMYRIEWAEQLDGLLEAFRTFDMAIEEATGLAREWQFRVLYGSHDTLSSFSQHCADRDIPLSIDRVYNPAPPDEDPAYGLTDDQQEAIRLAFGSGYYEIPRSVTMAELGEKLDISRQAVSNRLRRGLEQLLAQTIAAGE